VADDEVSYAGAVLGLLRDRALLQRIRDAALQDAQRYTLGNMVQRFVEGIEACLARPPRH
jgi:glycosyltransferase involved in cell wall biosynthesis